MPLYTYLIGAGNNVALASLVNIETITPTSDRRFPAPRALVHRSPGVRKGRLNGVGFRSGFPKVRWYFGALTFAQYEYLKTTYCSSGYSGLVTIYTRTAPSTYTRYNAVMDIPEEDSLTPKSGGYGPVIIEFTHLVAL